jgi:predicted RNase H-like HicB family nuclease
MRYAYPAIFSSTEDGGFCVIFPDIKRGATQGDNMMDAIEMAEDFLCLALYDMEEDDDEIPSPSNMKELVLKPEDFATLITADTERYRRFNENKMVKKTLTVPSWLNARAEVANINFSQTLQKALKAELKIAE